MDFNLDNFFARMESESSIAILLFLLGAFLFGILVNALLSGAKKRRLRARIAELEDLLQNKELELVTLREGAKKHEQELVAERHRAQEAQDQLDRLEADKKRVYTEVYTLNQEVEQLRATNQLYATNETELKNRIAELEHQTAVAPTPTMPVAERDQDGADTYDAVSYGDDATSVHARLELIEDRMTALSNENQRLRQLIEERHAELPTEADQPVMTVDLTDTADTGTTVNTRALGINTDKSVIDERIVVEDRRRDRLSDINGIGPFLETKLNQVGIYTYEDLAQLDRNRYAEIENRIGWVPGRIEQDDWVGQAARLSRMHQQQPDNFEAPAERELSGDDLQRIEGIGPRIETILKEGGIHDYETLASVDPDDLRELLVSVDPRFVTNRPETWPAQARMAAQEDWDELDSYQQELRGDSTITDS